MNDWREYTLKELLGPKGYVRGPFGSALRRSEMQTSGYAVYEQQHAIYNTRKFRYFIDENKFRELARFQTLPNDLIISCSGTVGEVSVIRPEDPSGIISQALLSLRPDVIKVSPKFLYYFFKTKLGHGALLGASHGSVQVNIANRETVENIRIRVPSLRTQDRITDILSSLDDKIELNNAINKNLEELTQALFKHWFVDFEFPNENGEPYKSSGGEMVESELGEIPRGWRVAKYGDIVKTTSGGTPNRSRSDYYESGNILWVKSKELNNSMIFETEEKINDLGLQNSSAKLLPPYSVLIAMYGATVGQFALMTKASSCNQAVCAILENDNIPYSFNYLFFQNYRKYLANFAVGSAQQNISQNFIKNIQLVVPNSNLLASFHTLVDGPLKLIENNCIENHTLAMLRDNILPKLMSGELNIQEAQKMTQTPELA